jgi:hypothetical protein
MAPVREVAFELECFEWADERLEVAGRWKGLGNRRLSRPVLTVETATARRKRIVALPGGHMGAGAETWRASFAWPGDPADITGAALEVGGSLVVDLPLPDRRRRRRRRPPADQHDEALRAELGALRGQVERLRAELAGREREIIALRAQLDADTDDEVEVAGADERTIEIQRLAGERDAAIAGADSMTVEIERLAEERDAVQAGLAAEVVRLASERDAVQAGLAAEVQRLLDERATADARWQADVDDLREAFSEAAAEAEAVRDRHRAEVKALEEQLRAERAEVARRSAEAREATDAGAEQAAAARALTAAPPTQPMPAPVAPTEEAPAPEARGSGAPEGAAALEPAVPPLLDAPGPLRAGSRPASPPLVEDEARGEDPTAATEPGPTLPSAVQSLQARIQGLLATNGHGPAEAGEAGDGPPADVPRPRRTAAAARARAGASVAARRSPAEVWGMRVLAAVVVVVLLAIFVLILTSIA